MLVLGRRKGEKIVIGEGIVVTVVTIQGERVRLGIEAPPEVSIRREEIAARFESYYPLGPACRSGEPALLASP